MSRELLGVDGGITWRTLDAILTALEGRLANLVDALKISNLIAQVQIDSPICLCHWSTSFCLTSSFHILRLTPFSCSSLSRTLRWVTSISSAASPAWNRAWISSKKRALHPRANWESSEDGKRGRSGLEASAGRRLEYQSQQVPIRSKIKAFGLAVLRPHWTDILEARKKKWGVWICRISCLKKYDDGKKLSTFELASFVAHRAFRSGVVSRDCLNLTSTPP